MKNRSGLMCGICVLTLAVLGCDLSKYTSSNHANSGNSSNTASPSPPREMRTPPPADPVAPDFTATLRKWKGKYPYEVKLIENSEMQSRLKKMMAGEFADLKSNFKTETPIEIENDIFLAHACEPHNCGGNEYYIYVDLKTGNVNVYHIIDGRTKTFFEQSKISLPQKFADDMGADE